MRLFERQPKEFTMTTYFHHRHGVQAVTLTPAPAQPVRRGFNGTQGLSALLLAAMVSALLVVANQVIDTLAHGHLMVAWVALWLVGFTAIALFADAAHKLASVLASSLAAGWQRMAKARATV